MAEHPSTGIRNVVLLGAAAALAWSVVLPERLERPAAETVPPVALDAPSAPPVGGAPAPAASLPPAPAAVPLVAVRRAARADRPAVIDHVETTAALVATSAPDVEVALAVTPPPPVAQATVTSASVTAAPQSIVEAAGVGTRSAAKGRGGNGKAGSGSTKRPDAAARDDRWTVSSGRAGAKSDDDHGPTEA